GQLARVEKINMRATTIRTIDNVEIIVPNENFLTNAVTTYTKTDRRVRVLIPFGVSYDSDPNLVRRLALKTAAEHEMVLSDPPPSLLFRAFGESSLDFELAVWMDRPARRARLRSDLYYLLWEVFDENKIELPFPQRDIHIKGDASWFGGEAGKTGESANAQGEGLPPTAESGGPADDWT
ncbi:MAG TPA: mechanosensitive ion channel domain-containing protein, partial [Anaerolineales bacterium]|nr:mechanosensitive ion channel domain-containing protein [Anaerolineales bacterium]